MKTLKSPTIKKFACIALNLLIIMSISAEVPAFDSDKPVTTFSTNYTQAFNTTWDGTSFYGQWDAMEPSVFGASDIASGYLQFVWPAKRIIYSKSAYATPYTFTADFDYTGGSSRAGVVIRAYATDITNSEFLQEPPTDPGYNREGIAFYPTDDGASMNVQFSAVESGRATTVSKIVVPKLAGIASLRDRGTITVEDFGTTIYVYYNGARFIRIDLGGKIGSVYTSGTVYDADMVSKGTFTGMEVLATGKVAVAQRDARLKLYSATLKTFVPVNLIWDNRPATTFTTQYSQVFNSAWDGTTFYGQWDAMEPSVFGASDIASGYLQFVWPAKRIIYSKSAYATPYTFTADIDYTGGSSRAGVVLRAVATNVINADYIQQPLSDPGFNQEGIAFYLTDDGASMNVQFSGVANGALTPITKIVVPKPAGVTSLRDRGVLKIEDYGTSIYVFYNAIPYIRIDLGDKIGTTYTSGTVYDATMNVKGTFSGMEVEAAGKVAIAQRDAAFKLYSAEIKVPLVAASAFDKDKPLVTYASQYKQEFNMIVGWDSIKFYSQWNAQEPLIFDAADIQSNYLQFSWIKKRIIYSKSVYVSPYVIQSEIDYTGGSSRGGVVIRGNVKNIVDVEFLQEPPSDPGYNREGIAFYPSDDGAFMNVQFSGIEKGRLATTVKKISVPKPASVTSFRNKGIIRIEDFGASIYVYYNDAPLTRIDMGGKTGTTYTSGTVYNSAMEVLGIFSGMEIETIGKVAIAQRDAALKLFNVTLNYNELTQQSISFTPIGQKLKTDSPFALSATASSGLPVEYKLVSGPATLVGSTVSLNGQTGIVTIAANQSGNSIYYPAPEMLRSFYVGDPAAENVEPTSQEYVDNWVATDALGRTLPTFEDAGSKRQNKLVGVFYYIWHGFHGDKVYNIPTILSNYPTDPLSVTNPNWGGENAFHFWGEPEADYHRAEDPWVIRRDLQMLSNAKVDFIYIDVTNAITYIETVKTLCEVSMQMRKEGIYTPQIVFTTASKSGKIMNNLYDEFYANSLFENLWFKWNGKPLILGDFNDLELRIDVKNFFTIKYSWAWTNTKTEANHWQWIDSYPQDYGWSTDPAIPEQIAVAVASHPNNSIGSSYSNGTQPSVNNEYLTNFTGQGLHFAEQWKRALAVDPPVVMVTQWNEWVAQRFIWNTGNAVYAGKPIKNGDSYFVDAFTEEFNRDMAPMKGGHTDNYYYQLISNIRKYKGMATPLVFSAPLTITLDGNFADWSIVSPVFKDPKGDVMHRDFSGYDPTVQLVNTTGRNDIVESRATFDANNVYFYVKTVNAITSSTDPNWMLLFIDVDRNKGTGWEGYDYVVNLGVKSASETTLKKWDGTSWGNEISVPFKLSGNEMELSVPRAPLLLDKTTPEFYFHWADNPLHLNDISSFFTDGESAPDRRFNYNFSASKVAVIPQTAYKPHTVPGTIEFEDFDNGGAGIAYSDAALGNSGGVYRPDESVDIEAIAGGGYNVGWINSNEWLSYTVDIKAMGTFNAKIKYASNGISNEAVLYVDGVDKYGVISFPSSGGLTTWISKEIEMQLYPGKHILKFYIKKANNDFKIDKIDFIEKDVVYPGKGTGLSKSIWTAALGGRTWFKDSICSEIDPVIDQTWTDVSPGCNVSNDFWNIRWQGQIQPLFSEDYTFYLTVNDMGRVWINNQLLIDGWLGSSSGTTITGAVALIAGQKVPIKVDFAEKTADAKVKLEWSSASNPREVIPQSQLFPMGTTGISDTRQAYFNVYPNPATNNLTITSGENQVAGIKIIDLQGRVVFTNAEQFSGKKSIKIDLDKGIYFIILAGDIPFAAQKLIVE
ncbi:MAG: PA14 domain-containing protein [Paludibacter sp.]|nr:PA14 domain-containing protein [Paludibacter sp.]